MFLPANIIETVADHVHDAGLNAGLGEHCVDRLGETLEAIDDGDEDVAAPPGS